MLGLVIQFLVSCTKAEKGSFTGTESNQNYLRIAVSRKLRKMESMEARLLSV